MDPINPSVVAGRFRLLGALGKGNMGEVYRAEDQNAADAMNRVVAVKLLLSSRYGPIDGSVADSVAGRRTTCTTRRPTWRPRAAVVGEA